MSQEERRIDLMLIHLGSANGVICGPSYQHVYGKTGEQLDDLLQKKSYGLTRFHIARIVHTCEKLLQCYTLDQRGLEESGKYFNWREKDGIRRPTNEYQDLTESVDYLVEQMDGRGIYADNHCGAVGWQRLGVEKRRHST